MLFEDFSAEEEGVGQELVLSFVSDTNIAIVVLDVQDEEGDVDCSGT